MSSLSSQLVTVTDRVYLLSELDSVSRSFFSSTGSHDLQVLGIRSTSESFWSQLLHDEQQTRESLEKLRVQIQNYRVIHMRIAFEPDRPFLEKVITVFRKNLGENYLLSVEVVPSLSAGIIYTIDGKIIDLSLATKLKSFDLHPILHTHMPVLSS